MIATDIHISKLVINLICSAWSALLWMRQVAIITFQLVKQMKDASIEKLTTITVTAVSLFVRLRIQRMRRKFLPIRMAKWDKTVISGRNMKIWRLVNTICTLSLIGQTKLNTLNFVWIAMEKHRLISWETNVAFLIKTQSSGNWWQAVQNKA